MIYRFKDYQFNSVELTLYKGCVAIPIRNNEARVLALLLNESGYIVSKKNILDVVWSGKVVSEQAVFQNISSLRTIFGEQAIKTFSGKGYQWQLVANAEATHTIEKKITADVRLKTIQHKSLAVMAIFATFLMLLCLFSYSYLQGTVSPKLEPSVEVTVLPISVEDDLFDDLVATQAVFTQLQGLFIPSNDVELTLSNTEVSFSQFTNTPEDYFSQITQAGETKLLLALAINKYNDSYFLRYELHGEHGEWSGEFKAETINITLQQFAAHLPRVVHTSLLVSLNHFDANHSELELLHQLYPKDVIISERLIDSLEQRGELNKAQLLAESLEKNVAGNLFERARTKLLMGEVLAAQGLTQSAEVHFNIAQQAAEHLGHFRLQSDIAKGLSLVGRNHANYSEIVQHLRRAMSFARVADDPLRELSALNYLYIFSYKLGYESEADLLLKEAELLLQNSDLPQQHYAQIYLHKAVDASEADSREAYARQLLALFAPSQTNWLIDSAQTILVELLIEQQRWDELNQLFIDKPLLSITENYLVAKHNFAQQRWSQATIYATESFKRSSFIGEQLSSLNAALLLVELHKQTGNNLEQVRYEKFITSESTELWLSHNHEKVSKLGLTHL